mgnify:CR=1 FL=1
MNCSGFQSKCLRGLLLAGAASAPAVPADAGYFEGLRDRVRKAAAKA